MQSMVFIKYIKISAKQNIDRENDSPACFCEGQRVVLYILCRIFKTSFSCCCGERKAISYNLVKLFRDGSLHHHALFLFLLHFELRDALSVIAEQAACQRV